MIHLLWADKFLTAERLKRSACSQDQVSWPISGVSVSSVK